MKVLLLTLFVAFVTSAPVEDVGNAVEVIVNGVPEGEALQVGDIVDIKLKEHSDGQVVASTDLLHPFSAAGIAEAAAVAEIEAQPVQVIEVAENEVQPVQIVEEAESVEPVQVVEESIQSVPVIVENVVAPAPVVLPAPVAPEVIPAPIVLPEVVVPEVIPDPVVMPEAVVPEVIPDPVIIAEPVAPEVPEISESLPVPQHQFGEIYNDGNVQVTVNAPEDEGILATLQSWMSLVINYFNNGAQTSQQIL